MTARQKTRSYGEVFSLRKFTKRQLVFVAIIVLGVAAIVGGFALSGKPGTISTSFENAAQLLVYALIVGALWGYKRLTDPSEVELLNIVWKAVICTSALLVVLDLLVPVFANNVNHVVTYGMLGIFIGLLWGAILYLVLMTGVVYYLYHSATLSDILIGICAMLVAAALNYLIFHDEHIVLTHLVVAGSQGFLLAGAFRECALFRSRLHASLVLAAGLSAIAALMYLAGIVTDYAFTSGWNATGNEFFSALNMLLFYLTVLLMATLTGRATGRLA